MITVMSEGDGATRPEGAGVVSGLAAALAQFDRTEANLIKLEAVWSEIADRIPEDVEFGLDGPESAALFDRYDRLVAALPAIDGYTIAARPCSYDEIAEARFGYWEIGEPLGRVRFDRALLEPGEQIAVFRQRMESARRKLVSARVVELVSTTDTLLATVRAAEGRAEWCSGDRWAELESCISEIRVLCGSQVPGRARWSELSRHLHFGASNDLSDIVTMDWPSVRAEIEAWTFDGDDPIEVGVDDLGLLVAAKPSGPVPAALDWSRLDSEQFERLVFELIRSADGYENTNWLMKTNAPDRGRDIETYRVITDSLAGVRRTRVIVQCKHWQSKSIGPSEIEACVVSARLWRDPPVDAVIVATSGRYTTDAVSFVEMRRAQQDVPTVELWAENDVEMMLARRPHIAAEFGLR
jgi:hypothetical protein